jgi:hypothetical protein
VKDTELSKHQIGTYKIHFDAMPIEGSNPQIDDLLNTAYSYITQNKKGIIERLKDWVEKYPHIPQFKNNLYLVYMRNGRFKEAVNLLQQTIELHPNYFFGKVNLAFQYLKDNEIAEAEAIMGIPTDIQNMYPERTEFHISEIISYQKYGFDYYLLTQNWNTAEIYLDNLKKFVRQRPELESETKFMKQRLVQHTLVYGLQKQHENFAKVRKVKSTAKQFFEFTDEPPVFNHPEIDNLYYHGIDIPNELIKSILALPRPTLIEDLETMLADFQRRNPFYQAQIDSDDSDYHWQFYFHPIFLLAELRAEDSLPAVLNVFRQDQQFNDFWFGDYTEDFLAPLYQLAHNQLPVLAQYLREENNDTWPRRTLSQIPTEVVIRQPDRRAEVIEWYRELLTYFIDNHTNHNLIDGTLIASLVSNLLDIEGKELSPLIEQLYILEISDEMWCGNWETVKSELRERTSPVELKPLEADIITLYRNINHRPPIKYVDEAKAAEHLKKLKESVKMPDEEALAIVAEMLGKIDANEAYKENKFLANTPQNSMPKLFNQPSYGRNDKVTVKYKNGKVEKDVKFKKIEEDWQNGECEIID